MNDALSKSLTIYFNGPHKIIMKLKNVKYKCTVKIYEELNIISIHIR